MTGGDNGSFESGTTDYTIAAVADGTLSFDWNYTTQDGPFTDPFEFLLNGIDTTLTDPGGVQTQSGSFISILLTGDTFGFRIRTTDNVAGPGFVTISNFDISNATPVPFEFNPVAGVAILGSLWAGKRFLKSRKTK